MAAPTSLSLPSIPLLDQLTTPENKAGCARNIKDYAAAATEIDRLSTTREKTGVFTGSYAVNPINGRAVPIWTADYVLASYGTGVVMAVPAHDERDFEFATKYNLPIERVIAAKEKGEDDSLPYTEHGVLVNSPGFDGMNADDARKAMLETAP